MLTHGKYLNIVEEMIDKRIPEINQDTAIEYLYDELQKERKINEEFHEYFSNNVKPQEIGELVNAYHKSIALATDLTNRIIKENKQLKEQLRHKHCLNSCLMYVIELGGVKEDG